MKIGIYYRVSTDKQDLASQEHAVSTWLEGFLKDKEATQTIFKDEGISGTKANRPGFKALVAAIERGEIDTVVVYRLDRLSRHAATAIQLLLDWIQRDVQFFAVAQPIFQLGKDNPFRLTMVALFSELAQIEREVIVERIKAGLEAAKKRGQRLGRPPGKVDVQLAYAAVKLREKKLNYKEIGKKLNISAGYAYKLVKKVDLLSLMEFSSETLQ